jgi:hypothetical protein
MAKEKTDEPTEEIKEGSTIVVSELPKVDARNFTDEDRVNHPILTTDEAIAEILEKVRRLDKVWGK